MTEEAHTSGTRDEAVAWLMDRVGLEVNASVYLDLEYAEEDDLGELERVREVMTVRGKLAHWTTNDEGTIPGALKRGPRDDLAGGFAVGEAGWIELDDFSASWCPDEVRELVAYEVREAPAYAGGDSYLNVRLPGGLMLQVSLSRKQSDEGGDA